MQNRNVNQAGQTHDQLQAACWRWACKEFYPLVYRRLISVPNDAARDNKVAATQLQAIGVTKGAWDMPFFWLAMQNGILMPHTYWWEFKVGRDKLSDAQIKFRDANSFGHTYNIASEEDQFQSQFNGIVVPLLEHAKNIFKGTVE